MANKYTYRGKSSQQSGGLIVYGPGGTIVGELVMKPAVDHGADTMTLVIKWRTPQDPPRKIAVFSFNPNLPKKKAVQTEGEAPVDVPDKKGWLNRVFGSGKDAEADKTE